jgi:hypothetical protein
MEPRDAPDASQLSLTATSRQCARRYHQQAQLADDTVVVGPSIGAVNNRTLISKDPS